MYIYLWYIKWILDSAEVALQKSNFVFMIDRVFFKYILGWQIIYSRLKMWSLKIEMATGIPALTKQFGW